MGYDIALHKLPPQFKNKRLTQDDLFEIAYNEEYEDSCIRDTNFSLGNSKAVDFARIFDIILTNDDYFKLVTVDEYVAARSRLSFKEYDEHILEKVHLFLEDIKKALDDGETIFFCCG